LNVIVLRQPEEHPTFNTAEHPSFNTGEQSAFNTREQSAFEKFNSEADGMAAPINADVSQECKRQIHLSAEQKRRGVIKNAFEELARILPNATYSTTGRNRISNAAVLQKTCETIQYLKRDREQATAKQASIQEQIDEIQAGISDLQNRLPESGVTASRKDSDSIQKNFFQFCKDMIYSNPKAWIFCIVMKPLFDSYNKNVNTTSVNEFLSSVIRWLDQYCTLPFLRPIVLETLTDLSTRTNVLEDANCIVELAQYVAHLDDPTVIPSAILNEENVSNAEWKKSEEWG